MARSSVEPPDGGWGWVVVAAVFMITLLSFGSVYSIGILFDLLMEEFGATKSQVGIMGSIATSLQCFLGPLVSILQQKIQARIIIICGCFLVSTAFICSSFVPNVTCLYFTFGVVAGVGTAMAYLPQLMLISFYFEKHRTVALALGSLGSYVGCFAQPYLMRFLISEYGWRGACFITGAIGLNSIAVALLLRPVEGTLTKKPRKTMSKSKVNDINANPATQDVANGSSLSLQEVDDVVEIPPLSVQMKNHDTNGSIFSLSGRSKFIAARPLNLSKGWIRTSAPSLMLEKSSPLQPTATFRPELLHQSLSVQPAPPIGVVSKRLSSDTRFTSIGSLYNSGLATPFEPHPSSASWANLSEVVTRSLSHYQSKSVPALSQPAMDSGSNSVCRHFQNREFCSFVAANFLIGLAINTPQMYIVDWAKGLGISTDNGTLLLSLYGIGNIIGRPVIASISDSLADYRLLLFASMLALNGSVTMITPLFENFYFLVFFMFQFAFLSGGWQTLLTPILADMVESVQDLSTVFGILISAQGVAFLLGPPLLALLPTYGLTFSVAGLIMFSSSIALLLANYIPMLCVKHCQRKHNPVAQ